MKNSLRINPYIAVLHLLCLLVLSYTLIIKSIFSSTDTLNKHLSAAGLYADVSNIVKTNISARLDQRFQDKYIQRAAAGWMLNAIVTPQFIEKQSQRALPLAANIISRPLDIQNNKVVISTEKYKQKINTELSNNSSQIPDLLKTPVNNLMAAVPGKLTLVDMSQRPNSILGMLTKAKIVYGHINLWNNIALTVAIITALSLIFINRDNVRRLFKFLTWAYLGAGVIVFAGSYIFPYLIMLFNTGGNLNLNNLMSDATYYVFAQTRMPGLILLALGGFFYLFFRWSYIDALQLRIVHMLSGSHAKKKKVGYAA